MYQLNTEVSYDNDCVLDGTREHYKYNGRNMMKCMNIYYDIMLNTEAQNLAFMQYFPYEDETQNAN